MCGQLIRHRKEDALVAQVELLYRIVIIMIFFDFEVSICLLLHNLLKPSSNLELHKIGTAHVRDRCNDCTLVFHPDLQGRLRGAKSIVCPEAQLVEPQAEG